MTKPATTTTYQVRTTADDLSTVSPFDTHYQAAAYQAMVVTNYCLYAEQVRVTRTGETFEVHTDQGTVSVAIETHA